MYLKAFAKSSWAMPLVVSPLTSLARNSSGNELYADRDKNCGCAKAEQAALNLHGYQHCRTTAAGTLRAMQGLSTADRKPSLPAAQTNATHIM